MPEWKLDKASYTVTGAPVVLEDLADALAGSVLRLLVVALVVMALVLALVFRSRLRIVPLAVALAAVAVTFGAMALIGAPLTMASIAVLPVLLGLGVDYAIQFQARVEEEGGDAERAVRLAGPDDRHGGARDRRRVPRAAALARADGARVRRAAGGRASCSRCCSRSRPGPRRWRSRCGASATACWPARCAAPGSWPTAPAPPSRGPPARVGAAGTAVLRAALRQPGRVLAIGLALAAFGWALDSQTEVVSDVERLVPQDLRGRARPADAAALDRRRGRGRRDRRGRGPHRPEGRRLDARLPGRAAEEVRLLGDQRLRQGGAVPGAVADRPVPRRAVGGDQGAGARAARRGAAVLLPVGDHARTARRPTWRSACGSCRWTASRRSSTTCARG